MRSKISFLLRILRIGLIGFGGGNALIPVIEQTLQTGTDRNEAALLDRDVVVANLTPGALPVEVLSSVGRRYFGIPGMIGAASVFALPGAVIVILIMTLFAGEEEEAVSLVKVISAGISAFIICLLIEYVANVLRRSTVKKDRRDKTILMILMVCFVVCGKNAAKLLGIDYVPVFGVSTITVLAAAFFFVFYVQSFANRNRLAVASVLTLLFFLMHGQRGLLSDAPLKATVEALMVVLALYEAGRSVISHPVKSSVDVRAMSKDIACWLGFMCVLMIPAVLLLPSSVLTTARFIGKACLSSLMSFGGGDAYLAVAEGLFVDSGIISHESFFSEVITAVNGTPGSILCKTLSAIGFVVGSEAGGSVISGIAVGLAGFGCSVAMSCIAFGTVYHLYDSLISLQMFCALSRWIRPIVAGLLINVALSLVNQSIALNNYIDVQRSEVLLFVAALTALNYFLRRKLPDPVLLVADALIAVLYFGMTAA